MANIAFKDAPKSLLHEPAGLRINESSNHLRNYAVIEKHRLKILAGWFLRLENFDHKYKLAYHLYDASEHISWLLMRLKEMRGGNPNASVRPELKRFLEDALHAPTDSEFLFGFYGVLTRAFLGAIKEDLQLMDASGNANELRILKRIQSNLETQMEWFKGLQIRPTNTAWTDALQKHLNHIGGIHGEHQASELPTNASCVIFERPKTILFDASITIGQLEPYENRLKMDAKHATIEQFKVFFNEFYAAALLASILFDASDNDYPWEFFADFSRHFWDEARHSEFGAIRLRELGVEPDRVNPILFEESQNLPILHRVAYLTRGLEAYFMPRKPKRMKEYEESGDLRSQLFADQDWSDEINHVRYGSRWTDYLLEDDYRDVSDIIDEVKKHLSATRGYEVTDINAPF